MSTPVRQSSPPGAEAPDRPERRRAWARGRRPNAALARIEARHLARSPLLGAGLGLALLVVYVGLESSWPALAGDDLVAYVSVSVVGGGALLAGAWLGLRDRATGAADLVAVTPTAPWRLQRSRLAAVAAVAAAAFAALFAAVLALSAVRGGRGTPDLRLLADGMLVMVLSGWVGLAVGRLSGSRMVSVLAAPVWAAVCLVGPPVLWETDLPVQRLLPALTAETRSAEFGFLPDALWSHLGYLTGVVLCGGVLLLALAARGSAQRPPLAPVVAAGLAGLVLVGVSGSRLAALPDREVVVGPGSADRRAVSVRPGRLDVPDPSLLYPPDDRARSCVGDATLTVCVYPAYGEDLAGFIHAGMDPVARLLAGLPGLPASRPGPHGPDLPFAGRLQRQRGAGARGIGAGRGRERRGPGPEEPLGGHLRGLRPRRAGPRPLRQRPGQGRPPGRPGRGALGAAGLRCGEQAGGGAHAADRRGPRGARPRGRAGGRPAGPGHGRPAARPGQGRAGAALGPPTGRHAARLRAAGTATMTPSAVALARIEARHLARSPLLWLGVALGAGVTALEMSWYLPALAGDDLAVYRGGGFLISGGALLAGAWVALRDTTTGAADLVAVTPTAPWRPGRARLAGVAAAAAGVFALAFAVALAVSAIRGGRGLPDLRLLVDGALAVVLSGWVGVAVGRVSGSRMVAVLAAPVWVVLSALLAGQGQTRAPSLSVQHLAPVLNLPYRSAAYGFLPDPLWPHLGYLLGLTVLVGVLLVALVARGGRGLLLAVAAAGLVLAGTTAPRLLALPDAVLVLGPDRSTWKPVQGDLNAAAEAVTRRPGWSFPADGHARTCAGDATLTACVYPAYGQRLARSIRATVGPVAGAFAGLPGVPTRVRMVPVGSGACGDGEVQVGEPWVREPASPSDEHIRSFYVGLYLHCALGSGPDGDQHQGDQPGEEARAAVDYWAQLTSGQLTRERLRHPPAEAGYASLEARAAALAMAELPPDQVRAELTPVWARLRAGTLPLSELPGQRP